MKVLHVGNIANNAYSNAKFLRRLGVEADVLMYDYTHVMGTPEWEDAEITGEVDEFTPDYSAVDLGGFVRPSWFLSGRLGDLFPEPRIYDFDGGGSLTEKAPEKPLPVLNRLLRTLRIRRPNSTNGVSSNQGFDPVEVPRRLRHLCEEFARRYTRRADQLNVEGSLPFVSVLARLEGLFEKYDILQLYGTDPIYGMLYGRKPFVAFEHGTMRSIPFENKPDSRLLALAYHKAEKVLITNPDVIDSAHKLGLSNYQYIPHPIDDEKFKPSEGPLRSELTEQYGAKHIFFAPARHNWVHDPSKIICWYKGNDRVLRAFARFLRDHSTQALLILCAWGQEVEASRNLIVELGIAERVLWLPPQTKRSLVRYYNACDVVFDQFVVKTFGTTAPEAMSSGRPVVLNYRPEVHEWCFPEHPPVITASQESEIFDIMVDLSSNPSKVREIGEQGVRWIKKYHSWEVVARRQVEIYDRILSASAVPAR